MELQRIEREADQDELATDVRDLANQPLVVRYVNLLVRDAYDAGASDIHLESTCRGLGARFRLDCVLVTAPEPPAELQHAVISRIKLVAELDIAERRRPQDGRIRVRLEDRELDLRVSTVSTMFGESVVLRLLDRGGRPVELTELGMSPSVLEQMLQGGALIGGREFLTQRWRPYLGLRVAERLQVGQIPLPASRQLVLPEFGETDECNRNAAELTSDTARPCLVPGHARESRQKIDADRRHPELNDDIGTLKILRR